MLRYFAKSLMKLRNPITRIKNYKSNRGMSWRTDITDWLGGLPYEVATVDEIFKFIKSNLSDFNLVNIKTTRSTMGNNWFLFKRNN